MYLNSQHVWLHELVLVIGAAPSLCLQPEPAGSAGLPPSLTFTVYEVLACPCCSAHHLNHK